MSHSRALTTINKQLRIEWRLVFSYYILHMKITVSTTVHAPIGIVWDVWNTPEHIMQWNAASDDWHCPHSENDLRVGGVMCNRMEARDGSMGFDYQVVYTEIEPMSRIVSVMTDKPEPHPDDRTVAVTFTPTSEDTTEVVIVFDAETENSPELQQAGWQAILDSFTRYAQQQ